MAAFPPIVSLKLGSQTLGLAKFEIQPNGGLALTGYCLREIVTDPAREDDRLRVIGQLLPPMMHDLALKPGPVNYAVSSEWVFTRLIRLPPVDQDGIARMIRFEAQQIVPFPIGEVVWDYQLLDSNPAEKLEVILVAIKTDLLDRLNSAVEGAGLRTNLVDVTPMALYNAFRATYHDLRDCSLVIDIGARTTDLLFVEPGKVFTRTTPIGGSSITAAVAKEFGEPFAAADLRKKQHGFISLGGADAGSGDPEVERVATIMRKIVMRLYAEVARSISFYCMQQQGSQPERVFLCGGAAATPGIREFLQEKLQRPVDFLNPLRNLTIAHSIALDEVSQSAHLLGELVGLALRSSATCPIELNLRPASVVRRQDLAQRQPFLLLGAVCFLLGLLAWGSHFGRSARAETKLANALQVGVERMHGIEEELNQLHRETTRLDEAATPLLEAVTHRGAWTRILDDLNLRLPKRDIWITELAPTSDGKIVDEPERSAAGINAPVYKTPAHRGLAAKIEPTIDGVLVRGLYLSNPRQQEVVVDYFRNLLNSTVFEIKPSQQAEVIRPSTPTTTEWAYPYELRLKLPRSFALR